ncbi:four helix bundle protein [Pedobacter sp. SYP-B3415]|uniref:four helix bundle protein n=1 Tax=Pedobacter sp. SYP-B3415 TaxID=2496641 RepID=UPI00101D6074|nr:four helix bundle protein [Pedobacter sp. SYP-B3415]
MQNYKDLLVWQRAHKLVLLIYEVCSGFPREEDYALVRQLKRAAYSIPVNIAEGSGRLSKKDFAHFLQIALGSVHELEYLVLLAKDLSFLAKERFEILNQEINEIKAMLIVFIKKIRQ